MPLFKVVGKFLKRIRDRNKPKPVEVPAGLVVQTIEERNKDAEIDLTTEYYYDHPEEFWAKFQHTGQIKVPKEFDKWLIGQEEMVEEWEMNLEEWVRKMKVIEQMRESGQSDKTAMNAFLKEWPGPYLAYVGKPGLGKSLLLKIAKQKLKELYKKYDIKLQNTFLIKNPLNAQRPLVKYVPAEGGLGKRIVSAAEYTMEKKSLKISAIRGFLSFVVLMGILAISTAIFALVYTQYVYDPEVAWFFASGFVYQWLLIGVFLTVFPLFILGMGSGMMGGGNVPLRKPGMDDVPNLIIDNDAPDGDYPDLGVDMTQGNPQGIFGAVSHDPYQSGGLGTPAHHRMQAGTIHKADKKILFADEFKNILLQEKIVIELLTPLEDGMYPIRGRAMFGNEGNASIAGETQPIDCAFFLIAAMNYDSLPLLNNYPALRNRFHYGNIKRAEDEILATPKNEIKMAQFLSDESFRFHTPDVCSEAVKLVIGHSRRKASAANKMLLQMRPYIQDIKKSAQLTWYKPGRTIQCSCQMNTKSDMIHASDMQAAIDNFAKPIEQQILDAAIDRRAPYRLSLPKDEVALGIVNGLVVISRGEDEEGKTGDVAVVTAWLKKVDLMDKGIKNPKARFVVTGATQENKDTWISNSIETVKTAILQLYGIDLETEYYVHVSFIQSDPKGMDGPSAGITMTLAIMSQLGDPRIPQEQRVPVPMRQDTAITGTVENFPAGGDVRVGPIGGVFEKSYGARKRNIMRVILPKENRENTYFDRFSAGMEVIGAETVLEYFDLMRADKKSRAVVR